MERGSVLRGGRGDVMFDQIILTSILLSCYVRFRATPDEQTIYIWNCST